MAMFFFATFLLSLAAMSAVAKSFDHNGYPSIDIRLFNWPLAVKGAHQLQVPLECYTTLDDSFMDGRSIYRLDNGARLDRTCLLRIPTGTRLTITQMDTASKKSYVALLAGSSQVYMPLRTEHIHAGEYLKYGPWHVPHCSAAYLVFNLAAPSTTREWVEFRLEAENAEDAAVAHLADCGAERVVNYADMEFHREQQKEQ